MDIWAEAADGCFHVKTHGFGPVPGRSPLSIPANLEGLPLLCTHGTSSHNLAVLKAQITSKNHRIQAGIGPQPTISLGKWQSAPSPGTPRGRGGAKNKIKNHFKHSQDKVGDL